MTRSRTLCALVVLLTAASLSAKQRAVMADAPDRCVTGVIARQPNTFGARFVIGDDSHIYWWNEFDHSLYRVAKRGGPTERLARLEREFPATMTIDESNVYLGVRRLDSLLGAVLAIPKSGGVPVPLASDLGLVADIEVDATHVYWLDAGMLDADASRIIAAGRIERALKDGTARETVAANLSAPFEMALIDDLVWFGENGSEYGSRTVGLRTVPKSGGAVTVIENQIFAYEIVPSGAEVLVSGFITRPTDAIFVVRKDGVGGVRTFLETKDVVGHVRARDGIAYYVIQEFDKYVLWSMPVAGGTPVRLRDDLAFRNDFDVDACAITVATNHSTIERMKR
jgi:hypothetical protein